MSPRVVLFLQNDIDPIERKARWIPFEIHIPMFHHSIIPDARQTRRPGNNSFILNRLVNFRDIYLLPPDLSYSEAPLRSNRFIRRIDKGHPFDVSLLSRWVQMGD